MRSRLCRFMLVAVGSAMLMGCVKSFTVKHTGTFTVAYSKRASLDFAPRGTLLYTVPEEPAGADRELDPRYLTPEAADAERAREHAFREWRELSTDQLPGAPVPSPEGPPTASRLWDRAYSAVRAAYADPASAIESLEPNFEGAEREGAPAPAAAPPTGTAQLAEGTARVGDPPAPVWPAGEGICWSRGSKYSQLEEAARAVGARPDWLEKPIVIAHLDTGYAAEDPLLPPTLSVADSRSFIEGETSAEGGVGHGSSTLSTLAGGQVRIVDDKGAVVHEGAYGSNPFAQVREYRISDAGPYFKDGFTWGPVHVSPKRMSTAIAVAADSEVDVISLSAGGLPSLFQAWAVDRAYEHGTAIVAATGDFFVLPLLPYSTPTEVVYPARYDRVMGVAGVTSEHRSYGFAHCHLCLFLFSQWDAWMLRGSFGPTEAMRGHVISGYAPNICQSGGDGSVDRDGGGTSAATPQVAGAAALWLAAHRADFREDQWRTWRKTEAVYQALMRSADRSVPRYEPKTMGEGILKARQLLDTTVPVEQLRPREPSRIDPLWLIRELLSMGIFGGWGLEVRPGLLYMVETEIRQIVYRSRRVSDTLSELDLRAAPDRRRFATALVQSGEASEELVSWLRRYLEKK